MCCFIAQVQVRDIIYWTVIGLNKWPQARDQGHGQNFPRQILSIK
jgi:hypothetical protein